MTPMNSRVRFLCDSFAYRHRCYFPRKEWLKVYIVKTMMAICIISLVFQLLVSIRDRYLIQKQMNLIKKSVNDFKVMHCELHRPEWLNMLYIKLRRPLDRCRLY